MSIVAKEKRADLDTPQLRPPLSLNSKLARLWKYQCRLPTCRHCCSLQCPGARYLSDHGHCVQIVNQNAVAAILALSLVVPLSAHVFDLSVGAMLGLSAAIVSTLMTTTSLPVVLIVVIALCIGGDRGFANAFFVVTLKVESLIATLASAALIEALVVMIHMNKSSPEVDFSVRSENWPQHRFSESQRLY